MVRLAPEIRAEAGKYVRLRLSNMRGLDLNVFDFDYDLNWIALMMTADGVILARFSGKELPLPQRLAAFRHTLAHAAARPAEAKKLSGERPPRLPEDYPLGKKTSARSCIHCHHVHEFQRDDAQARGAWQPAQEYRYPDPATLGLQLDAVQPSVASVTKEGSAARAGLGTGDMLIAVNGTSIVSTTDLRFALDRAPLAGSIPVVYERAGVRRTALVVLDKGWKERTDISWRWSLKSLRPDPPVVGEALDPIDRRALGIALDVLALRQGPFLSPAARRAGLQIGDILLAVDAMDNPLTPAQFEAWFRLTYQNADRVTLHILRGKERLRRTVAFP